MTNIINKPPIPGLLWGMYPEKTKHADHGSLWRQCMYLYNRTSRNIERKAHRAVSQIHRLEKHIAPFDSHAYKLDLHKLQADLRKDGFKDQHVIKALALIKRAYSDQMHIDLYDTQLLAAYYMLNNQLAEMATGEGKTFAVTLAAATAALCGVPVHVITANDYLAERDAHMLKTFYQSLGLHVDAAIKGQDASRRKIAYAADIVYCTAKELVFDYLRDKTLQQQAQHNLQLPTAQNPLFLRGLCMAIIDEADSILLDEARVPLILSKAINNQQEKEYHGQSLSIACNLEHQNDFQLDTHQMQVYLTPHGQAKLEATAITLPTIWHNRLHREEAICMALAAIHLYERDHHYVVDDGKVSMIDATTGRIAKGRSWSRGLQQLIELKEGCEPSDKFSAITQITYQRFFPKYIRLCGISGTLTESRKELMHIYGLPICKVPLLQASKRKLQPMKVFQNTSARNASLIEHIKAIHQLERPILIATDSVAESEQLSKLMHQAALTHQVLNAKHDKQEAELIAKAGAKNAITITTNMAGRGTDINIAADINQLGGLHVISCQANSTKRIDRQLIGRTARHGQNGSAEIWLSLDNPLISKWLPKLVLTACKKYCAHIPTVVSQCLLTYTQLREDHYQTATRKHLLKSDIHLEKHLKFGEKS